MDEFNSSGATHSARLEGGRVGRRARIVGVIAFAAAMVACMVAVGLHIYLRQPRIDATSDDTVRDSLARINARLDDSQRQDFAKDCMTLAFSQIMATAFTGQKTDGTTGFKPLHGLTPAEVHERAEAVRAMNRSADVVVAKPPPAPPPEPVWTPAGSPARVGDVQVDLVSAAVGPVLLRDGKTSEEVLAVTVRITSLNPTRKVEYNPWQEDGAFTRDGATAGDNFGNKYKPIHYQFSKPAKTQLFATSVYPAKPVEDLLTFEVPLNTAEYLVIDLPAVRFGGEGVFRFRVPRGMLGATSGHVHRPDPTGLGH